VNGAGMKICKYCGKEFQPSKFDVLKQQCCSPKCGKKYDYIKNNSTYKTYRQSHKEQQRVHNTNTDRRLKEDVIGYYSKGTMKCTNLTCEVPNGARDIRALTIDHINGGGNKHRKQVGTNGGLAFYYWLKRNNYPEGFQVLCCNCQAIKRIANREMIAVK
jgi:hypothetical protein